MHISRAVNCEYFVDKIFSAYMKIKHAKLHFYMHIINGNVHLYCNHHRQSRAALHCSTYMYTYVLFPLMWCNECRQE